MPEWQTLADSSHFLSSAYGTTQPTSASAVEGLAEMVDDAAMAAKLRSAVAAYQAKNPLYRELNYISRDLEEYCFFNCISANGSDAAWGERLGKHLHFSYYGLLGYLMLLSPTLGDALCTALRFPLQLGSYFRIRLQLDAAPETAQLQFADFSGHPERFRFHMRLCAEAYRQIIATLGVVSRDSLTPVYRDDGGNDDALRFPARLLKLPLPYAQAGVFTQTLRQCEALERQISELLQQPLVLKVRTLLSADLKRLSSMATLAGEMHMTERTLHRHLRKCGTSFQALLDDIRLHTAVSRLHAHQHSIAEIADELGFADTAAFKHAFKRWTGHTPTAWTAGRYGETA